MTTDEKYRNFGDKMKKAYLDELYTHKHRVTKRLQDLSTIVHADIATNAIVIAIHNTKRECLEAHRNNLDFLIHSYISMHT